MTLTHIKNIAESSATSDTIIFRWSMKDNKTNEHISEVRLKQAMMQTGTEKLGQISCQIVYYEHCIYPFPVPVKTPFWQGHAKTFRPEEDPKKWYIK